MPLDFESRKQTVLGLIDSGRSEVNPHGHVRTFDVSRKLGVTQATALRIMHRLSRDGLIEKAPYSAVNDYAWRCAANG